MIQWLMGFNILAGGFLDVDDADLTHGDSLRDDF